MKWALLLFISLVATGCGGVPKTSLTDVDAGIAPIVLTKDYKFDAKPMMGQLDMTLKSGEYHPYGQDTDGLFYVGPVHCLRRTGKNVANPYSVHCGIFRPFGSEDVVYVFEFVDDDAPRVNPYTKEKAQGLHSAIQAFQNRRYNINKRAPISMKELGSL